MDQFDGREFRDTLGQFATGVVIATGCLDGTPAGFAAQSFASLSLDPPLVALCPSKTSVSWPQMRESGHFCINILSASQQDISDLFAQTGIDKFADLAWQPGQTGSPVLAGVLAYIDCELADELDAGDHTIAIGRVRDLGILEEEGSPLLYWRGAYGTFGSI